MPDPPMIPSTALVISRSRGRVFHRRPWLECFRMQLDRVPDLLLSEIEQSGKYDQKDEDLQSDPLSLHEMGFCRPHQKGGYILCILFDGGWRPNGVVDALIGERGRHPSNVGWKDLVVVAAGRQRDPGRWIVLIALQQRCDVINTVLLVLQEHVEHPVRKSALIAARLRDHGHVGRHRTVAGTPSFFVRERGGEMVRQPPGAFEHPALVVGPVLNLVLGGDRLGLRRGEARSVRICKIAKSDHAQPMTGRANLTVDYEPALKLRAVIFAERAGERPPVLLRACLARVLLRACGRNERNERHGSGNDGARRDHSLASRLLLSRRKRAPDPRWPFPRAGPLARLSSGPASFFPLSRAPAG